MIDHTAEKDRSEIASEQGFTGTFAGFIDWLEESLVYGSVRVHEPAPDDFGRMKTRVETVTGGFSSDELLLGRLKRHWYMAHHWVSSARGGLTIYEFPTSVTSNQTDHVWLEPEDGVFERLYRARRVRIYAADGSYTETAFDDGVEFVYEERDRDINEPDGLVIIRPAKPLNDLFSAAIQKGTA